MGAPKFEGLRDRHLKWLLLLPTLTVLFALCIYPLLWSLGLSFYEYSIMKPLKPVFIGMENYARFVTDRTTWVRFQITGKFVALAVALEFLVGFGLAMLLSEEFRGRRLVLTLILIPMMCAPVAMGVFFRYIYEPTFGVVSYFASLIGIRWQWYTFGTVIPAVVLVDAWMWSPFMMLIILAGLSAVPRYLYEAANIDRANWRMKFRYITLPMIKPLLAIALLFRTMDAFKLFDTVFILTDGGPGWASETLSLHIYRQAFRYFHTGSSCALSYAFLVIIIMLSNLYLRYLTRKPAEATMAEPETEVEM